MNAAPPIVDLARELSAGHWARPLMAPLERLLGIPAVNRLYAQVGGRDLEAPVFCRAVLEVLGVETSIEPRGLQRLAELQGPVLVTSNHPLGGRDALLLHLVLGTARSDYRILANRLLGRIPETRAQLILVDPFGGPQAASFNRGGLREALRWLERGGLLGVFPAGEVSFWQPLEGRVADKPWAPQALRLAEATGATVVPLHISGSTSPWLQGLARLHPALKTPCLARELVSGPAKRLEARLGEPIPALRLVGRDPEAKAAWLRDRVYALAGA